MYFIDAYDDIIYLTENKDVYWYNEIIEHWIFWTFNPYDLRAIGEVSEKYLILRNIPLFT